MTLINHGRLIHFFLFQIDELIYLSPGGWKRMESQPPAEAVGGTGGGGGEGGEGEGGGEGRSQDEIICRRYLAFGVA